MRQEELYYPQKDGIIFIAMFCVGEGRCALRSKWIGEGYDRY